MNLAYSAVGLPWEGDFYGDLGLLSLCWNRPDRSERGAETHENTHFQPTSIRRQEELQDRIWKDETFVDFDRSLATAINNVRQASVDCVPALK